MNAQPEPTDRAEVQKLANAVEEALAQGLPTAYRDATPVPLVGVSPPIPQPGRPPMSQRAVDLNTTILSSSVLVAALGGAASVIMWASGYANTTVIGWICGCAVAIPVAVAIPLAVLKSVMKSAKEVVAAAPSNITNNYNGPVRQHYDQREIHSRTSGVWVQSNNQQ